MREEFRVNAEDDFQVLLELSGNCGEEWRSTALERKIKITFPTEEALKRARRLADEKYPVELGSALHDYLDSAIRKLEGKEPRKIEVITVATPRPFISIERGEMGLYSIIVDDFSLFQDDEQVEQGVEVAAYELEESVLALSKDELVSATEYDCESSMFNYRSSSIEACLAVVMLLCKLLENVELRKQYLHKAKPQDN